MMRRDPYRRHRRRARRRWRGREDAYPVLMFGPDESLGLIALAAMARWAYRHRSAFVPLWITGAVFAAGAVIHDHHPGTWPIAAGITVLAAVILGIPHRLLWGNVAGEFTAGIITRAWEACGIDRPAERAYATAITIAAGGWLSAAIAVGPAVKPLPAIAGIATVILGIPWWAHRRRRAKVRVERNIQAWPNLAGNINLAGSEITSAVTDKWGWTARVALRKGITAGQVIEKLPAIESGLGIRPGSARAIPDGSRADRVILRVIETDPHANPIPWPGPSGTTITGTVELGLFEDGRPVSISVLRRNVLIGGTTGSGKSAVENVLMADLVTFNDALVWGIDLKGGMELQPWANCLGEIAVTPRQATALIAEAVAELDRRAATLAGIGKRTWQPTPGDPALVIVADEYAEMPPEALEHADSLARRGRAVAVNLIAATQRPTQEAMGGNAVRSQMDVRISLRVREKRDGDLILGQGMLASGWQPHALAKPGEFLVSDPEHPIPERARGYLITDEQIAAHAARHALAARADMTGPPGPARNAPRWPQTAGWAPPRPDAGPDPEGALWDALSASGPDGATVGDLIAATGMGRSWIYYRLRDLSAAGRAERTARGTWRAVSKAGGA